MKMMTIDLTYFGAHKIDNTFPDILENLKQNYGKRESLPNTKRSNQIVLVGTQK